MMSTERNFSPIQVLLVEDNPADIRLTREGLKEAKVANVLNAVMDGRKALDYLHRRGDYKNACKPDVVILDLNLPGMDGREVLRQMKADPVLRLIPVVIMTSSEAETDIMKAYELYANCFITKPLDLTTFLQVVHAIDDFWFTVVKLP
ncbi:MAG TPA: response regulator [Devosiaceae bacterium]|jgi:CheY-like chemotaxis protein|nr:response regulator [Devosiaceae bacterium]